MNTTNQPTEREAKLLGVLRELMTGHSIKGAEAAEKVIAELGLEQTTKPRQTVPIELIEQTERLIEKHDPEVKERARMEVAIIREAILCLRAAGYTLIADDGESELRDKGNTEEMIRHLMGTDESNLITRKDGKGSFVQFVLGNDGFDVIADYGTSIESDLAPALRLSEWLEDGNPVYLIPQ